MSTIFKKQTFLKGILGSSISLLGSLATLALVLGGCSLEPDAASNASLLLKPEAVRVNMEYSAPKSLNLEGSSGLNLAPSVATGLSVQVTGCVSGYTLAAFTITSGVVNLYNGDRSCLVQLMSFTLGATTYSSVGVNAVPFTTYLAGNVATYQSTTLSTDLIKVFVGQQVTQGGLTTSDLVTYYFTDVQAGAVDNLAQATVSTAVPLSATGQAAPNFTVAYNRYVSTNANGSGNLSFSLMCGNNLTGTGATAACDGVILISQLDYLFLHDSYSAGAITVAQANLAFANNAGLIQTIATTAGAGGTVIEVAGTDVQLNTLAKGGFYTSNSTYLITGSVPIFPSQLANILLLRRKDASGNTMSYLYFYVNIASITQL